MSVAVADPLFRPVRLGDLAPAEVAARLRHLGGLVFFDSALERPSRTEISIIAAAPPEILRGSLEADAGALQTLIAKHDGRAGFDDARAEWDALPKPDPRFSV